MSCGNAVFWDVCTVNSTNLMLYRLPIFNGGTPLAFVLVWCNIIAQFVITTYTIILSTGFNYISDVLLMLLLTVKFFFLFFLCFYSSANNWTTTHWKISMNQPQGNPIQTKRYWCSAIIETVAASILHHVSNERWTITTNLSNIN